MSINLSDVVIVIPSYNEGLRIGKVIREIKALGFQNIVIVDDGSTDNSMDTITDQKVVILRHLVNRGSGAATETGLKYCREALVAKTVVMIDADTQHDPADIFRLIEAHEKHNADITIGNRFMEGDVKIPFKNKLYNQIANIITTIFAGKRIYDSQSGFKVFNRNALNRLIIEQDRYEHCSEIFIKACEYKLKIIDVPIKVYYNPDIKDKGQNFFVGIRTFINLLHAVLFKNK